MTISEFIDSILAIKSVEIRVEYAHPTLYIICTLPTFDGMDSDARFLEFCKAVGMSAEHVSTIIASPMIELALVTERERQNQFGFLNREAAGTSWLRAFTPRYKSGAALPSLAQGQSAQAEIALANKRTAKAIHFYGYKGGQGRSTVLVALAKV